MMKYNLIFCNKKYIGFSDASDKKIIKTFIKCRTNKHHKIKIVSVNENQIPSQLLKSNNFIETRLEWFDGYFINKSIPLFQYEFDNFEEDIITDCNMVYDALISVMVDIENIKLLKSEYYVIKASFSNIIDNLSNISDCPHENPFCEYVNVRKYLKRVYCTSYTNRK